MGKLPAAGNVHAGFVDQALWLGSNEGMLANKQGSVISYASPSIGGFSFQVDAQGDSGGAQDKDIDSAQFGATLQLGENAKIGMAYVDRATTGADTPDREKKAGIECDALDDNITDETPSCKRIEAMAADGEAHLDDDRAAMIVGHYTLGGVSAYLGYGQRKWDTDSKAGEYKAHTAGSPTLSYNDKTALIGDELLDKKKKTTFFGFHGGIGDTGVNFVVQVRSNKTDSNKVKSSYRDDFTAAKISATDGIFGESENITVADGTGVWTITSTNSSGPAAASTALKKKADDAGLDTRRGGGTPNAFVVLKPGSKWTTGDNTITGETDTATKHNDRGSAKSSEKNTPFTIGVSRSLGGGATIHLEHANKDDDAKKNQTALILQVAF